MSMPKLACLQKWHAKTRLKASHIFKISCPFNISTKSLQTQNNKNVIFTEVKLFWQNNILCKISF